jgi:hypothetical protein
MNKRTMNGNVQYETQRGTWAEPQADGAVLVYDTAGSWLGWTNAEGALMSSADPGRSFDGRVYSAAQAVRHSIA